MIELSYLSNMFSCDKVIATFFIKDLMTVGLVCETGKAYIQFPLTGEWISSHFRFTNPILEGLSDDLKNKWHDAFRELEDFTA